MNMMTHQLFVGKSLARSNCTYPYIGLSNMIYTATLSLRKSWLLLYGRIIFLLGAVMCEKQKVIKVSFIQMLCRIRVYDVLFTKIWHCSQHNSSSNYIPIHCRYYFTISRRCCQCNSKNDGSWQDRRSQRRYHCRSPPTKRKRALWPWPGSHAKRKGRARDGEVT